MRYAIYFAAEADDPLMKLGNSWLGRDPFSDETIEQPVPEALAADRFHTLTGSPRRYGFHGTLKAPFSLSDSASETDLMAACSNFAKTVAPFEVTGLSVNRLGRFLALTPNQPEPALNAFADACVVHFEPFRAPLSEVDLERRRKANLTDKQDAYVEKWGYPYIFDEFRFHMTLSEKLENDAEARILSDAANAHFQSVTGQPRTCRNFGLYTEETRGAPFKVRSIFELTGHQTPHDFSSQAVSAAAKETA